jgi:hypothetical protein
MPVAFNVLSSDSITELTMERIRKAIIQTAQSVFNENWRPNSLILSFDEDSFEVSVEVPSWQLATFLMLLIVIFILENQEAQQIPNQDVLFRSL